MMDWDPTLVHFDLTQSQDPRGLVEVDEPSFHSPTLDSLSQAAWVIIDDGTPEEKRQRRGSRYSSLVKVGIRDQMPVAGVCQVYFGRALVVFTNFARVKYSTLFS